MYVWDVPPVGIQNVNSVNNIYVYPNPFNSVITLKGIEKDATVEVFNILGSRIYSLTFGEGKGGVEIDLSNETNGMYFIKVQTENGLITKKIVKE